MCAFSTGECEHTNSTMLLTTRAPPCGSMGSGLCPSGWQTMAGALSKRGATLPAPTSSETPKPFSPATIRAATLSCSSNSPGRSVRYDGRHASNRTMQSN
eukprot:7187352-Prymnesium_polylepis.1